MEKVGGWSGRDERISVFSKSAAGKGLIDMIKKTVFLASKKRRRDKKEEF